MESHELVTKRQVFTEALCEGLGVPRAAELAGFSSSYAVQVARTIMLDPKIRNKARLIMRGKIDLEGAPEAYAFIMLVMRSPSAPLNLRLDAAKYVMNHSLAPLKAQTEETAEEKPASEMTDAELQEAIRQTEVELVKRGIMIDATPIEAVDSII